MTNNGIIAVFASFAAACTVLSSTAYAQDNYPNKPVQVLVGFAAGGVSDLSVRVLANKLSEEFGQPFVVENRGGAGGRTGTEAAARAEKDGYSLYLGNAGTHAVVPAAYKSVAYDPVNDFTFIAQYGEYPFTLVCNPGIEAKSAQELIDMIKEQPGVVTFANPGAGGQGHMLNAFFENKIEGEILHVGYKGAGPAMQDVIAGVTDCTIDGAAIPHVTAGSVVPFAVTSAERDPRLPEIPTMKELGFEDFVLSGWLSLMGPKGLPDDVVSKLDSAIKQAVEDQAVIDGLTNIGVLPRYAGSNELKSMVERDLATYKEVAAAAEIALE